MAQSLEALRGGRGGVLMIEGGPGSGRTELLEQLGIDAQLDGATVLRAQGAVHSAPLDAAMHLVRTGLAIYPELDPQFREGYSLLAMEPKASAATGAAVRYARMAAYLQDTLLHLSHRSPLVLLLDDMQLIDPQSIALLASMTETLGRDPILLAVARLIAPVESDAEPILRLAAKHVTLTPRLRKRCGEARADDVRRRTQLTATRRLACGRG